MPLPATAGDRVVLGRYRLLRRLGAGGFGVVWLAWDERLEREVAVKALAPAEPRGGREALAAARLAHPAIVALFEAGGDHEGFYLVSELVRGATLAELLAAGALEDGEIAAIGVALCDALEHAHQRGVVHRDVKPQNVIVPDDPQSGPVKLTDFGVACIAGDERLTRTGDIVGTLAYMSPEQADGRPAGPAADLYALGLVLYEAFSGSNPVRGHGPADTARRVGRQLPALARSRRDLSRPLTAAIDRAVLTDPADRGSIAELRGALAPWAAPSVRPPSRLRPEAAGHPIARRGRLEIGGDLEPRHDGGAPRRRPVPVPLRVAGAFGVGGLALLAFALTGPQPPVDPLAAGLVAAVLCALLPRAGALVAAATVITWLALPATGLAGVALLALAACLPAVVLVPMRSWLWTAPAAAPLLGLAMLAGAFPALAGQLNTAWRRAAIGAAGWWWLVLAEPLLERRLLLGPADSVEARGAWEDHAGDAAEHVIAPTLSSGLMAGAVLWALAAMVLPWLVRGRSLAADVAGALAWSGALVAATGAVGHAAALPEPRGAALGALAAVLLAIGARALRGPAVS